MKTVIVYATVHETTEAVAIEIKKKLGDKVTLANLDLNMDNLNIDDYDNVIIGSGIYVGKISKKVSNFIGSNKSKIMKKNYGVYICSREEKEDAKKLIASNFDIDLLQGSFCTAHLGHGIKLSKLNFFQRILFGKMFKIKYDYTTLNKKDIDIFFNAMRNGYREKKKELEISNMIDSDI